MKMLPPIPPKKYSLKSQTSNGLGVLSIIIALIALIITIGMKDGIKEVNGGGGWVFVFFSFRTSFNDFKLYYVYDRDGS